MVHINVPKVPQFRQYVENPTNGLEKRVKNFYYTQHKNQTYDFALSMRDKWLKFNHAQLPLLDCLDLLSQLVDKSDPDVDKDANIIHAYQTAERMREAYPDRPWLHLTGLIHDLGKVMAVWGEEQWATVGDTYPVGCRPSETIVFGMKSFEGNSDLSHPIYNTKLGIYKEHCGLENLIMTWGHDEYMYQVLKNHPTCTIPDEALYAIRFHSFYPYHSSMEYLYFQNDHDRKMLNNIYELNNCDLYSKSDSRPDIEELKPYYQSLIDQYIPGIINW